jgi:hypothetical protein
MISLINVVCLLLEVFILIFLLKRASTRYYDIKDSYTQIIEILFVVLVIFLTLLRLL